ncbi:porin [Leptospira idonii]|nr:porin [Leptospira idonii]
MFSSFFSLFSEETKQEASPKTNSAEVETTKVNASEMEAAKNKEEPKKTKELLPESFQLGAFLDAYYNYNNNLPKGTERKYTTQAVRNDEFNVNLAYIDAKVEESKYRGRLALQYGTSVNTNYANEPMKDTGSNQLGVRNLQEAYVGFKVAPKTWIDGGIYFGHIGFESWISHLNWNYTRAFALDYVPYYTAGVRVSHQFSDKFSMQFHIMNGWQNITENNRDKSFGLQWKYKFTSSLALTVNQFAGNEAPDNERKQLRLYNNTILEWHALEWLSFAGSFDAGAQKAKESLLYEPWLHEWDSAIPVYRDAEAKAYRHWYHGTLWLSFKWDPAYRLSLRVERFYDPKQVLVATGTRNGFMSNGYTATLDLLSWDPAMIRLEYNYRRSADAVFDYRNAQFSKKEDFFVVAFSMKL